MRNRVARDRTIAAKQSIVPAMVGLLLCLLGIQLLHVAKLYSANWDEAHHLYDGFLILSKRDYRANAEVPPLVKIAAALPILHLSPSLPPPSGTAQTEDAFLSGRAFVFGNGGDRLLFPARLACIGFSLLTALFLFLAGKRFFGTLAALCGLLLFVFDPNVLAHGALVSTDMASACFILATVYAFFRYVERPRWIWLLATGLLAGLAMVAKFTGILIAPILLALALAEAIRQRRASALPKLLAASAAIGLIGWVTIWAFYGFRYAPAPAGLALSPALTPYLASMPHPADAARLTLLARFHLLPEAYLWGLANTRHIEWEYTAYFFGRVFRHGPWQYFPLAFLIKSTLPLLLLLLLGPWTYFRDRQRHARELIFLVVPVVIYFAVITTSHFDIGARHLMPIYPFLYVIAGSVAATLLQRGRGWAALALALIGWQIVTSVRVAPDYMAYGNEAWGGPRQVRRFLSDSNVDWGQQLKTVKQYLDRNGITHCWFAYFPDGAVQPRDYGIPCQRLPTPSGLSWFNLPMSVPPQIDGTVLISESDLDGVESGDGPMNPYDSFHRQQPVAILQEGVYVYQGTFAVPLASALVDVRRSAELALAGRLDEALGLAGQAARLAPDSPTVQLQLAEVLAGKQQWQQAADHYRLAHNDLLQQRPDLQGEALGPPIETGLQRALVHLHAPPTQ